MKIAGIICEYNPFHRGHAELIAKTRAVLGPEGGVVCVMGGNFVQRGEPAILPKHARAKMAVRGGADLVLELPVPWAIASAQRFAHGAVSILEKSGVVDILAFGSECGDVERLRDLAFALESFEAHYTIQRELRRGVSYAAAREAAARDLVGDEAELLRFPNNILAVEYLRAMGKLGSKMRPLTIHRVAVAHDGGAIDGYASASHIRKLIENGGEFAEFMPNPAYEILMEELGNGTAPPDREAFETAMLYRLRTMEIGDFGLLPDGGEGLWTRLMRYARTASTYEEILTLTKTKRYAHARLRRMCLAALLGVTGEMQEGEPPYIRVLAMGERGKGILREMKEASELPVITKPASVKRLPNHAREIFGLEARAADIYALLAPDKSRHAGGSDWVTSPVIL